MGIMAVFGLVFLSGVVVGVICLVLICYFIEEK